MWKMGREQCGYWQLPIETIPEHHAKPMHV